MKKKFVEKVKQAYIGVRKWGLSKWTKISEENRKQISSFISSSLNYLTNALLLAVPIYLLTAVSYPKIVICIWIILPFLEHYYIWFREKWKDDILK